MRSLDSSEWTVTRIIACLCLPTLTLSFVVVVDNQTSSKHVRSSEHMCRSKIQLAFSSFFLFMEIASSSYILLFSIDHF